MQRKSTLFFLILLFFPLFFTFIPESKADVHFPITNLPHDGLTLYYLIEGVSVLASINPGFSFFMGGPITLPVDVLKVFFLDNNSASSNEMDYETVYLGTSTTVKTTINVLSRMSSSGKTCPFYLKYSGLPNLLGFEFDWVYEYGGIKYVQWNDIWVKTILYHFTYQDGGTSYSFRFYYDYTSLVLVQFEEETTTNSIQTQYLKGSLLIGNALLSIEPNYVGEWNNLSMTVVAMIIAAFFSVIFGWTLVRRKSRSGKG